MTITLHPRSPIMAAFLAAGLSLAPVSMAYSAEPLPPLFEGMGQAGFEITTDSPKAQAYFNQGLNLAYGFNHAEARKSFQAAQQLDPQCAMCYWGEAYVLGPNINAPMEPSAAPPAAQAAAKAQDLKEGTSPKEQALIEAIAARYAPNPPADRTKLDQAYAAQMAEAARQFPKDVNVQTLYAEALMDLQPWDYWEDGGTRPKGQASTILSTLEGALAENSRHPGAIHLYIHAVEASAAPERALPYARQLPDLAPGSGHLVHMVTHLYYRLGLFADAVEVNRRAIAADERYFQQAGIEPGSTFYPATYHIHNIHFVMTAAQMLGDKETALEAVELLEERVNPEIAAEVPWVQAIVAAPYFVHAQFSDPETVAALPDPGDSMPYVRAAWLYAKGQAEALAGNTDTAEIYASTLTNLMESQDWAALEQGGLPARPLLNIAVHVLEGRMARAEGDLQKAENAFRQAIAVQDSLPYMEPPFWFYPVRQSLGAVLLDQGKAAEAEDVFRASLDDMAGNGWALYGLLRAQQAQGDTKGAAETQARLDQAWLADQPPQLGEL